MNALSVNLDLARKYGAQGPRYTSYPTALKFDENFDRARLESALQAKAATPRPLSLYFHLPFCESMCWFCGCATIISKSRERLQPYLQYLEREMDLLLPRVHPDSSAVQMHFGGGTPNYLQPEQIRRLGEAIRRRVAFDSDAEISVELDPRRLTREHVEAFAAVGATRASFGVQDLDPKVQETVNRVQPEEQCLEAMQWLRGAGFRSINVDLIYGLPYQTPATFADTIERVVRWDPDRFAVFNYAHVPWMKPGQKLIPESALPQPEQKLEMLKDTIERLTSAGFEYIGMDHFAKIDDELALAQRAKTLQRNFQGYSVRAGADICAFGLSSISQSPDHYRQNAKALPKYYAPIDEGRLPVAKAYFLSRDDQIRRRVIMKLMCDLELDFGALSRELAIDFGDYFADALERLQEPADDGLVVLGPGRLAVTDAGRLLVRNLAMAFDAHLDQGKSRYSRTI